jgi:hypothetical protein
VYWRIRQGIEIRTKKKRKELYYSWRELHGDDLARESAKLSEAALAGELDLNKIWLMVKPSQHNKKDK